MRIVHFDPTFGASGDMVLGALAALGTDLTAVQREIDTLGLPIRFEQRETQQHGIAGVKVDVVVNDDAHARPWSDIRGLIEASSLTPSAKSKALDIFRTLAEAEAKVHGTQPGLVHFHEVGGLDAIGDICGVAIAIAQLGIELVTCGPLQTGTGYVNSMHGVLPVPAPATAELIAMAQAPLVNRLPPGSEMPGELLTPTGAAILTTLASFEPMPFRTLATGLGFGSRGLPWPNALRAWLGEADEPSPIPLATEMLIQTNIDDMSPQHVELLVERLYAAGALEAWVTPVQMKKFRPAFEVSAIGDVNTRTAVEAVFMRESTTFGVRCWPIARVKAQRRIETIVTRWGDVRVKLKGWQGRVIDVAPEYDDCARAARQADVPLRDVWNEAHSLGQHFIGSVWKETS